MRNKDDNKINNNSLEQNTAYHNNKSITTLGEYPLYYIRLTFVKRLIANKSQSEQMVVRNKELL